LLSFLIRVERLLLNRPVLYGWRRFGILLLFYVQFCGIEHLYGSLCYSCARFFHFLSKFLLFIVNVYYGARGSSRQWHSILLFFFGNWSLYCCWSSVAILQWFWCSDDSLYSYCDSVSIPMALMIRAAAMWSERLECRCDLLYSDSVFLKILLRQW